jgi:hypothetical protein
VLAYPFAFDQFDNAQRAVEWGAASEPLVLFSGNKRSCSVRVSAFDANYTSIAVALEQLLDDPQFTRAAERFSFASRVEGGGFQRAVDIIESEVAIGHAHLMLDARAYSFVDAIAVTCAMMPIGLWLVWRLVRFTFSCFRMWQAQEKNRLKSVDWEMTDDGSMVPMITRSCDRMFTSVTTASASEHHHEQIRTNRARISLMHIHPIIARKNNHTDDCIMAKSAQK